MSNDSFQEEPPLPDRGFTVFWAEQYPDLKDVVLVGADGTVFVGDSIVDDLFDHDILMYKYGKAHSPADEQRQFEVMAVPEPKEYQQFDPVLSKRQKRRLRGQVKGLPHRTRKQRGNRCVRTKR